MKIIFTNFRKLIQPLQLWLLGQGKCVGCGKTLILAKDLDQSKNEVRVDCSCGRVYMYNTSNKTFRRALLTEIK